MFDHCKNKRTARRLASARKGHSIPQIYTLNEHPLQANSLKTLRSLVWDTSPKSTDREDLGISRTRCVMMSCGVGQWNEGKTLYFRTKFSLVYAGNPACAQVTTRNWKCVLRTQKVECFRVVMILNKALFTNRRCNALSDLPTGWLRNHEASTRQAKHQRSTWNSRLLQFPFI